MSAAVHASRPAKLDFGTVLMLAIPLALVFLIWWTFAPGSIDGDTVDMLKEAQTSVLNDWQSPMMSVYFSFFPTVQGALSTTYFLTLLFIALSLAGIARACGVPAIWSGVLAALTMITPAVLATLSYAYKDSFAAALFCPAVFLSVSGLSRSSAGRIARNFLLTAAALIRPEFIVIAAIFLALEAVVAEPKPARAACLNILFLVVAYFAINTGIGFWKHVARHHPEQYIMLSDLIDLSTTTHQMLVPEPFANGMTLDWLEHTYHNPDTIDCFWPKSGLSQDPHLALSYQASDIAQLRQHWLAQASSHPVELLKHRVKLEVGNLWLGSYYKPGVELENDIGLQRDHPEAATLGQSYLACFFHDFFHRHLFAVLLAPVLIIFLWRGPVACRIFAVAVGCGALYQLEFGALGLSPYYRFGTGGLILFWIAFYISAYRLIARRKGETTP